jgi:hypothetical protein
MQKLLDKIHLPPWAIDDAGSRHWNIGITAGTLRYPTVLWLLIKRDL